MEQQGSLFASAASPRAVQDTSREAYADVKPKLGRRQKLVFETLRKIQPATNTMLAKYINFPINVITPRVFELRGMHLVEEDHRDRCPITGKRAIFWRITNAIQ